MNASLISFAPRAAALIIAALLAATVTGCAPEADAPDASKPTSATPTAESAETPTAKPESPAVISAPWAKVPQVNSGIVSWEIMPGKGMNAAQAKRLSVLADKFITEHLLRLDRWQGKTFIKAGEMDSLAEKFTPQAYSIVNKAVEQHASNETNFGKNTNKWPKKQRDQKTDNIRAIGGGFVTMTLPQGGKGEIRNEFMRRVMWVDDNGNPSSWMEIKGRRANNTGAPRTIIARQSFKRVDDKWLINSTGYEVRTD